MKDFLLIYLVSELRTFQKMLRNMEKQKWYITAPPEVQKALIPYRDRVDEFIAHPCEETKSKLLQAGASYHEAYRKHCGDKPELKANINNVFNF